MTPHIDYTRQAAIAGWYCFAVWCWLYLKDSRALACITARTWKLVCVIITLAALLAMQLDLWVVRAN